MDKETLLALRGEFTRLKNRQGIKHISLGICGNLTPVLRVHAKVLWVSLGYGADYPVTVEGYGYNREAYLEDDLWYGKQGEARDKFLKHLIAHIDNVLAGEANNAKQS